MENLHEHFYEDLFNLCIGEKIGEGGSRSVYVNKFNSDTVFKIPKKYNEDNLNWGISQNVLEWENWCQYAHDKNIKKWLSPCISLSRNGVILIQERTYPIRKKEMPKKLPAFLADVKIDNFGIDKNNKVVCIDYSYLNTELDIKMVKVEDE